MAVVGRRKHFCGATDARHEHEPLVALRPQPASTSPDPPSFRLPSCSSLSLSQPICERPRAMSMPNVAPPAEVKEQLLEQGQGKAEQSLEEYDEEQ